MPHADVVELRMEIAASAATIFRFLSDPERFQQWMGVSGALPATAGDPYALDFPSGAVVRGHLVEIVPDRRVVFSWGYDDRKHGIGPGDTTVTIELSPADGGTLVTLRHTGRGLDASRREHRAGWKHYLSSLSNLAVATEGRADAAVDAYLAAWAEPDDEKRRALLDRCWHDDGLFRDAMGVAAGRDELIDHIAAAIAYAPGARLERSGPVLRAHGAVGYRWRIVIPTGQVVGTGFNVGELGADGLFRSVTGFWEPPAD